MPYVTSGTEHALMMPVWLVTALVTRKASIALVVLVMLARLKGNPMGTRGGVIGSNAVAGQHLPAQLIKIYTETLTETSGCQEFFPTI